MGPVTWNANISVTLIVKPEASICTQEMLMMNTICDVAKHRKNKLII